MATDVQFIDCVGIDCPPPLPIRSPLPHPSQSFHINIHILRPFTHHIRISCPPLLLLPSLSASAVAFLHIKGRVCPHLVYSQILLSGLAQTARRKGVKAEGVANARRRPPPFAQIPQSSKKQTGEEPLRSGDEGVCHMWAWPSMQAGRGRHPTEQGPQAAQRKGG